MKQLPPQKTKNGCYYTLIKRSDRVAIYDQRYSKFGKVVGYEVFIIKTQPDYYIEGNLIKAHELFPHKEAFGKTAWSANTFGAAIKKFRELDNKMEVAL
jgi:hypothetical protein